MRWFNSYKVKQNYFNWAFVQPGPMPGQHLEDWPAAAKQMPMLTEYHCLILKTRDSAKCWVNVKPSSSSIAPTKGQHRAQRTNKAHSKRGTPTHCRLNAGPPSLTLDQH